MKIYKFYGMEECFGGVVLANTMTEAIRKVRTKCKEWNVSNNPLFNITEFVIDNETDGVLIWS